MDQDELTQQFCELTGTAPSVARQYLDGHSWNLESAVNDYYLNQDEEARPAAEDSSAQPEYTGPRTLDGRPAPQQARQSASSSGKKPQRKTGLATLGSLKAGHNDDNEEAEDDDFDDDDDDHGRGDLFAGGEKSGLAVQDPKTQSAAGHKKIIRDLLSKARENSERPNAAAAAASPSRAEHFRGTGRTLGGDGVASRAIPDPRGPAPTRAELQRHSEPQQFVLHLWEDGFSIDEGELHRFDDPANHADLEMIRGGRAPLHLMNVRLDQPVDVKLEQHQEKWRQLPKKYKPFSGEGRRLGSEVPAPEGSSTAVAPSASTSAPPTTAPTAQAGFAVDSSKPMVNIRIQLPDGSRLPARFNTTHTVGDIYNFLRTSSPTLSSSSRPWVVATIFPNKDHTDHGIQLGEMPEFKRGGSAVVKWT